MSILWQSFKFRIVMVNLDIFLKEWGDEFLHKGKEYLPLFPYSVKIKLTGRCNLSCPFCDYWRESAKDHLNIKGLSDLFGELKELGTKKIHFSGGEVFVRKDIFDIFSIAKDLGFKLNVTSNGTLIDRDRAEKIVDLVDSITISLDSCEEKIHDKLRGKGNFKKSVKAIDYLVKFRKKKKKKLKIRVNTLITKKNYRSLWGMAEFVNSLDVDRLLFIPVDDEGEYRLSKKKIIEFYGEVFSKCKEDMIKYNLYDNPLRLYPFGFSESDYKLSKDGKYSLNFYEENLCFAPLLHSFIHWDGSVYPCCMLRGKVEPLGNITETPFKEIWFGRKYQIFREKIKNNREACFSCDDFLFENKVLGDFLKSDKF